MKQYQNSAKMTMRQNFNLKSPARGLLKSMVASALVACVVSTSFSAAASVAAANNLCSGIFAKNSAMDAHDKLPNASNKNSSRPNSSKPAISISLSKEELVSRIDNLIDLQLRIQKKSFNSENEFIQALAFFDRETKGLMLLDPSYQQLFKVPFFEISQSLKKKHAKADQFV